MKIETEQQEHERLMIQAQKAIDAARLGDVSSLKISDACIWLELHRPIAAMKSLGVNVLS